MSTPNTIELQNVAVIRDGNFILKDISFSMPASGHLGILGPNGAGKSSLLKILSADMIPSRGKVTILGSTFGETNLWNLRKKIGFVSNNMSFWFDSKITVQQAVCSGLFGCYGLPEEPTAEQMANCKDQLARFNVAALTSRLLDTLSDGERRKVFLARALMTKPELLIFDEPCSGLDIPARELLLEDIGRLASEVPIVYVSHHIEEIPQCVTRLICLKKGQIFKEGTKEEIFTSESLSSLFDYPLEVRKKGTRWYVEHSL